MKGTMRQLSNEM